MIEKAPPEACAPDDEQKEFLLVVRQAFLMIVAWIERRYGVRRGPARCPQCGGELRPG